MEGARAPVAGAPVAGAPVAGAGVAEEAYADGGKTPTVLLGGYLVALEDEVDEVDATMDEEESAGEDGATILEVASESYLAIYLDTSRGSSLARAPQN